MKIGRIVASLLVGAAASVMAALATVILDLYLTGHGLEGLTRERVSWPSMGVHLSIGDIIVLCSACVGAALAWRSCGRNA